MSTFHYSNLRVKFEGEEGSGPGVNRGFFAAMANALKTDEKVGKLSLEIKAAMKLFKQMKNLNVLISTEPSEKKKNVLLFYQHWWEVAAFFLFMFLFVFVIDKYQRVIHYRFRMAVDILWLAQQVGFFFW